jgi:hypothetical protein
VPALWLRYLVEYDAFSRSGRWAEAPIEEGAAAMMTPQAGRNSFMRPSGTRSEDLITGALARGKGRRH